MIRLSHSQILSGNLVGSNDQEFPHLKDEYYALIVDIYYVHLLNETIRLSACMYESHCFMCASPNMVQKYGTFLSSFIALK